MLTINEYTGTWNKALTPRRSIPKCGAYIRMPDESDAREYYEFKFLLNMAKKDIEFVRWMPKKKMNVWKIIKRKIDIL
jgi:hypothetical protein